MRWADQLIKLSNFELELLQTRLSAIVARREQAELKLVVLGAEGEAELACARADAEAAWRLPAFQAGLKQRKAAAQRDIETIAAEETGARDALAEAFERLKKYEHVAESHRQLVAREAARRDAAVLDEMGLRRAAGRR
ncbi:MAG TPA: flagellar export protein FliJ [Caulobacteraceae bacterium]|nr:flagellar export protein FliJ [Caulobacteraceae bacterium]